MIVCNTRNITADLTQCQPFRTRGALRGVFGAGQREAGQLPHGGRLRFLEDDPYYVVYSYDTPIGWCNQSGWTVPTTYYSVTTSKHQNALHRALRRCGITEVMSA